ncbi:MAG: hypothetical protein AB8B83_01325, partial [Bdellovibrionales bacterium]
MSDRDERPIITYNLPETLSSLGNKSDGNPQSLLSSIPQRAFAEAANAAKPKEVTPATQALYRKLYQEIHEGWPEMKGKVVFHAENDFRTREEVIQASMGIADGMEITETLGSNRKDINELEDRKSFVFGAPGADVGAYIAVPAPKKMSDTRTCMELSLGLLNYQKPKGHTGWWPQLPKPMISYPSNFFNWFETYYEVGEMLHIASYLEAMDDEQPVEDAYNYYY